MLKVVIIYCYYLLLIYAKGVTLSSVLYSWFIFDLHINTGTKCR